MPENKEEFFKWFEKTFKKKNGSTYIPKEIEKWFDEVSSAHKEFEKIIGGVRKTYNIQCDGLEKPADEKKCLPIYKKIISIIPDYLKYYGLSESVFLYPKIKSYKGISTSKHIKTYATRAKAEDQKTLDKLLSKLGEEWAKVASAKETINITISVSPKAFVQLGLFGVDRGSCFGNFNADKKYAIGTYNASFILMRTKDNKPIETEESELSFRGIGVFSEGCVSFCNRYYGGISVATYEDAIKEIAKDITQTDKLSRKSSIFTFAKGMNYVDNTPITFYPNNTKCDKHVAELKIDYSKEHKPAGDGHANWK